MAGQPMMRRTFLSVALASAGGVALSGCGIFSNSSGNKPGGGGGAAQTLRQTMPPVPHLDPAMVGSGSASGNMLQTGLMEGLVLRNPDDTTTVLPGVAKSWDISSDGKTYTFHLRDDAMWSNGDKVTAGDFLWNWERLLSPDTVKGYQYATSVDPDILAVAGADAFHAGTSTDFSTVGVKAIDDATLQFTLTGPSPLFLPVLAEWRTLPLNPKMVKAHPKDWLTAANFVGNGPYVLASWSANGGANLVHNDKYWDIASYPVTKWDVAFNDGGDTAAVVKFTNNETDVLKIEGDPGAVLANGSIAKDLMTGPASQFKCLQAMPSKNPFLQDVRIRKALSLAIDREAIAKVAAPDTASGTLVPSGIPGAEKVQHTSLDVDQAKQLLSAAGYAGGKGTPTINFLVFQETPWLEAVAGMWQKYLGIKGKIDLVDVGLYTTRRLQVQDADYVGFCYGYFGLTPPTLYKAVTMWAAPPNAIFTLPGPAAEKYQALTANTTMDPVDKANQMTELTKNHSYPEFQHFLDLMKQVNAAIGGGQDKLDDACIAAATAMEQTYLTLPVLSAGYSYLVRPTLQNLKITSYPDRVFAMKGVTVSS